MQIKPEMKNTFETKEQAQRASTFIKLINQAEAECGFTLSASYDDFEHKTYMSIFDVAPDSNGLLVDVDPT